MRQLIAKPVVVKVPEFAKVNLLGDVSVDLQDPLNGNIRNCIVGQYLEEGAILLNGSKAWSLKCNQLNKVIDTADNYSVRTIGVYAALLQMLKNNGAYSNLQQAFGIEQANKLLDFAAYLTIYDYVKYNSFDEYLDFNASFATSAISKADIADVLNEINDDKLNEFSFSNLKQLSVTDNASLYLVAVEYTNTQEDDDSASFKVDTAADLSEVFDSNFSSDDNNESSFIKGDNLEFNNSHSILKGSAEDCSVCIYVVASSNELCAREDVRSKIVSAFTFEGDKDSLSAGLGSIYDLLNEQELKPTLLRLLANNSASLLRNWAEERNICCSEINKEELGTVDSLSTCEANVICRLASPYFEPTDNCDLQKQHYAIALWTYLKSLLCYELKSYADVTNINTEDLIAELFKVRAFKEVNKTSYQLVRYSVFRSAQRLLYSIGVSSEALLRITNEISLIAEGNELPSDRTILAFDPHLELESLNPAQNSTAIPEKRGRGRPKGSKNKATLAKEQEAKNKETTTLATEKRGRGRPKGSKNKATLAKEQAAQKQLAVSAASEKRGRGRPKGSKNKATLAKEQAEQKQLAVSAASEKRGRGRPKGSKNKATLAKEQAAQKQLAVSAASEKRGRGRPKGSKNKATLANEHAAQKQLAVSAASEKRGRGRPKGSKNKATLAKEQAAQKQLTASSATAKRGRGRPKGSKNKTTLTNEKAAQKPLTASAATEMRGRGRPKGSKNKATLAKEQAAQKQLTASSATEKRGRGRPKGSKNKPTLANEQEAQKQLTASAATEKRVRGRPKGSKNKATLANEQAAQKQLTASAATEKRGHGRTKGSKNKATLANEQAAQKQLTAYAATEKRGRGRPKGSKNKATLANEQAAQKQLTAYAATKKRGRGRPKGSKNKLR